MADATRSTHPILSSTATVPAHVVHRTFVEETVVLNLETGKYHGLNVTGGRMLEALEREPDIAAAAAALAEAYGRPPAEIEADLIEFCEGLLDRGLIEIDPPGE